MASIPTRKVVFPKKGPTETSLNTLHPIEHKDPDGTFASFRAWVCVIGYNTNMVKA